MKIYAHSLTDRPESEWETLQDHSRRVADGAAERARGAGYEEPAWVIGLLHDIGKMKPAFQERLRGSSVPVSHSGEGGRILADQNDTFCRLLAGAIVGHHGQLPNPDKLDRRINEAVETDLPDWAAFEKPKVPQRILDGVDRCDAAFRLQFLIRFLYGCLTDADDRETAAFYREANGDPPSDRPTHLQACHRAAYDEFMSSMSTGGEVNALRAEVLSHVRGKAAEPPGLFTLTVPTGGGKTLASLGFGLDHADIHGLGRLIYVIPYLSIVEQTADVFRSALGASAVIEQHSEFDWEGEDETEAEQLRIAGASWDAPVVVTTAVQFFESLYAARKKRCRKLPSLAKSVIVIDEAQTLPRPLLRPCLAALTELMDGYGASVVLCTATQPSLTVESGFPAREALTGSRELAPCPPRLYEALRRVQVEDIGAQTDAQLTAIISAHEQILVIVDNRTQARLLFDSVRTSPGTCHLSTLMTAAHRRVTLAKIRERLAHGSPVRLISTSLIEAGVDIDFPLVLRAATGIDSLAQAAGRCNREGLLETRGMVLVFRSEHSTPPVLEDCAAKGREILKRYQDDPLSLDAVKDYFASLWRSYGSDGLDSVTVGKSIPIKGILKAIAARAPKFQYEDIETAFRLIDDAQRALVVCDGPYGASEAHLVSLSHSRASHVAQELQGYTVNVPYGLWRRLWDSGVLQWWESRRFGKQFAVLRHSALYDDDAGLAVTGHDNMVASIV